MNQPTPVAPGPAPATFQHAPGYRARRLRNWLLLGLLYAGYYTCRYNLTAVAPEMAKELKLSNQQTGSLSAVRDVGYAIGTFVNGLFADALGGKQGMAVGAIGTIALNLLFGWFSSWHALDIGVLITGLLVIRGIDGYAQGFGSPGMVKINAAWFRREERGKFAGLFGFVIQLGQSGVFQLSSLLLTGAIILGAYSIPLIPAQNWRALFFWPPIIVGVLLLFMWFGVKNYPEEAGYKLEREGSSSDPGSATALQRLPVAVVFRAIMSNPLTWVNAGAYLCTGFVRRAYDFWWPKYFDNQWGLGKTSREYIALAYLLPIAAVAGSFLAGYLSDTFFRSRRSPVAAALYAIETLVILGAFLVMSNVSLASPFLACVFLTLISFTCNSSHSIIGTAAVMDIGGPRMSGFALGVINSFQYLGAIMAGTGLGWMIDKWGWNAAFAAMLPFSLLGALLMTGLWWWTRGRDVKGA